MDNLIYILFICLVSPLAFMLLMLRKRSRLLAGYMLIGIFISLFVSELNTVLLGWFGNDVLYVTTTITPISEEILKALPILFYAIVFSDDRERVMPIAFALGVHAVCTVMVGYGICFVRKKKKLFYCGTFALLALAMIYHGIFNMLVQSDYSYLGFFLPSVTYIPILLMHYRYYKSKRKA